MKIPLTTKLNIPSIIHKASHLKCKGQLTKSKTNLIYLDVDDAYIPLAIENARIAIT